MTATMPRLATLRPPGAPPRPADAVTVRIGITGHIRLAAGTRRLVGAALAARLRRYADRRVYGVTCLAEGADQLFATEVLAAGGAYEVVLPALDYRAQIGRRNRRRFDRLLAHAQDVTYVCRESSPVAYAAAGDRMLDRVDRLIAVWDGSPGGPGGTADVVAAARRRRLPVEIVWPAGARRR
jgi:hypothetical protein